MSSAIVPVSSLTGANGLSAVVEGFEGQTIKPTQIRLVQQSSLGAGDTYKVGKLVDSLSGNHFDKLTVVPLVIKKGRVFFPPDKKVGGTPLCRSNDGITPAPNVPSKQASRCDICDHGPKLWRNFKLTGIKPDCDETINMLFIERESGFPYYLTIKGSSIKFFNNIYQSIFRDIVMKRSKGEDHKIYDYSFEITPTRVTGNMGNYYILNFTNLVQVAGGEYGPLYQMFVKDAEASANDQNVDELIDAEIESVQSQYIEA